jgi:hypothetical protein
MTGALFADLSGTPVVKARIVVPYSGIWHADVTLDRVLPAPLTGPQVLTLAGSTWACSVVRSGDYAGERRVRLVGGQGGWRTEIPAAGLPPPFVSPIGVPVALVLATAAGIAGELPPNLAGYVGSPLLGGPPLGGAYVFQAGPMSLVLQDILGDTWYMDPTGQVQVLPLRPPTPVLSPFTVTAFDGAEGQAEIATDAPGDWMPGVTFVAPNLSGTVSRVAHVLGKDSFRSQVQLS